MVIRVGIRVYVKPFCTAAKLWKPCITSWPPTSFHYTPVEFLRYRGSRALIIQRMTIKTKVTWNVWASELLKASSARLNGAFCRDLRGCEKNYLMRGASRCIALQVIVLFYCIPVWCLAHVIIIYIRHLGVQNFAAVKPRTINFP